MIANAVAVAETETAVAEEMVAEVAEVAETTKDLRIEEVIVEVALVIIDRIVEVGEVITDRIAVMIVMTLVIAETEMKIVVEATENQLEQKEDREVQAKRETAHFLEKDAVEAS